MAWLQLTIAVDRAQVQRAELLLAELGSGATEEVDPQQTWAAAAKERPRLRGWFEGPDADLIGARLRAELPGVEVLAWETLPDQDWSEAWKERWKPVVISERLVVAPPWDAPPGALIVEPGQGFGTGHHPTTRLMLAALEALAPDSRTVLDVGCGSGILALAAAKLGLTASGVDVHAEAIDEARANAERNALQAAFSTTPVADLAEPADLVLANLHTEILVQLAPDLLRLTGRHLLLCGILADREPIVRTACAALEPPVERQQDDRWVLLRYDANPNVNSVS